MSSSLCQGLQSCLKPGVIEPRVLRLKLAPPGSNISPSLDQEKPIIITNNECEKNDTKSSWSFLQALTETNKTENANDKVYVHPTVKRSSSMLSAKSLEMCTESLGSETGSNAGESSDIDVSLFSSDTRNEVNNNNNNMNNCVSRRVNKACNFPPPLTSITDFGGVHVRPHREGGRLILEAIASSSTTSYFHAERVDGRLKLSLYETVFDYDGDDEDYEGEEEEYEEEVESEKEHKVCVDDYEGDEEKEEEEEGESEKEHDEVVSEEECVEKVEDEMGVTKFGRPRRCKESGNRDFFGDGYFELPSLSLCL